MISMFDIVTAVLKTIDSQLVLTGDKYFESVVNLTTFTWNVTLDMLKQNINKSDWRTHGSATITNAIYNPVENSISK